MMLADSERNGGWLLLRSRQLPRLLSLVSGNYDPKSNPPDCQHKKNEAQ